MMDKYKNLHKWMILPMIFMQFGIFKDYWGDFTDNAWSVHIHYWTGTVWYLYLIIQPYYATHGKMDKHRTNGIIGMFLAGGVGLTALSMMHRDIVTTQNALEMPDRFGRVGKNVRVPRKPENLVHQFGTEAVHHRHNDDQGCDTQHDAKKREPGDDRYEAFLAARPQISKRHHPLICRECAGFACGIGHQAGAWSANRATT